MTVGLAVAECQVLTTGHEVLLRRMLRETDASILALGSRRKSGVPGHPFSAEERAAMVRALVGDAVSLVLLDDIDAGPDEAAWLRYVLARTAEAKVGTPTDYYAGSEADARWYRTPGPGGMRVHVVDRDATRVPPAREVRDMIERRDPAWKRWVPADVRPLVERLYPPGMRAPLVGTFPPEGACPVGTRFDPRDGSALLEMKDDGAWRPVRTAPDEKAAYALARAAARTIGERRDGR